MNPDTINDLIRKIAALVERGATDGERQAAQNQLDKLLNKYNLKIEDVLKPEAERKRQLFTYTSDWEIKLIRQLCGYVTGEVRTRYYQPKSRRKLNRQTWIELTDIEYAEVCGLYDHYRKEFEIQLMDYMAAFIQANTLGMKAGPDAVPPTPEELARLLKILGMAGNITPTPKINHLLGTGQAGGHQDEGDADDQ